MNTPGMQQIEARLARLEASNRRLRLALGLVTAFGAAVLFTGAGSTADSTSATTTAQTVRARRLVLIGGNGSPAFTLEAADDVAARDRAPLLCLYQGEGPRTNEDATPTSAGRGDGAIASFSWRRKSGAQVELYGATGQAAACLSATADGGSLSLRDPQGKEDLVAGCVPAGGYLIGKFGDTHENAFSAVATSGGASIGCWNRKSQVIAKMMSRDLGGELSVSNNDGRTAALLQVGAQGGSASVANPGGETVAALAANESGAGAVRVSDAAGRPLGGFNVTKKGDPVLTLHEAEAKDRIWAGRDALSGNWGLRITQANGRVEDVPR